MYTSVALQCHEEKKLSYSPCSFFQLTLERSLQQDLCVQSVYQTGISYLRQSPYRTEEEREEYLIQPTLPGYKINNPKIIHELLHTNPALNDCMLSTSNQI